MDGIEEEKEKEKEKEKKKNGEDDEEIEAEEWVKKDKKCCEILILMRNDFTTHAIRIILLSVVKGQVQADSSRAHYRERTNSLLCLQFFRLNIVE